VQGSLHFEQCRSKQKKRLLPIWQKSFENIQKLIRPKAYPTITIQAQSDEVFEGTQIALVTLFERRQLVQTFTLLGVPLTRALTLLTLAFQVLFDLL